MAFSIQNYPRVESGNFLDDETLVSHNQIIPINRLKELIELAIKSANLKSRRKLLNIPDTATEDELRKHYLRAAKELFSYFRAYPVDPAATAHQLLGRSYRDVGVDLFRASNQQKARMNSGWRYQYLVVSAARESQRFISVSDIGAAEADFNAVIAYKDKAKLPLSLYVSVKNRKNTLGGQDWPKAIAALEKIAHSDKNRQGHYCCIFGIAMDRGMRSIKLQGRGGQPYSSNTEVWLSDYFWPFFTNYGYEAIMNAVLEVLLEAHEADELPNEITVPEEILEYFGHLCFSKNLVSEAGVFDNPQQLVKFFVGTL
jgi:hypothetical protein